jgi:hypothetical protein
MVPSGFQPMQTEHAGKLFINERIGIIYMLRFAPEKSISVPELAIRVLLATSSKILTRVLRLELVEHVKLLLLVTGRKSHLLLSLIVHHLLNHSSGLTVEVAEVGVLGVDLGGVDGGVVGKDVGPPLHLVGLLEVDLNGLLVLDRPGAFVETDGLGELSLRFRQQSLEYQPETAN